MKEELSGLIGELKNDVDDKGTKIEEDRKARDKYYTTISSVNPPFQQKSPRINIIQLFLQQMHLFDRKAKDKYNPTISSANPAFQQKSSG